ncbi:acetyl-CoA acetyltransferase [Sphaerochaeta pleomorpha str. Grapes]|uniref:Acetyl-CoA acetyltransferase n=1 Tax=Sphaerochaeta pleomorpha (strain ATCC BAA-1885 / DSM 22778 / Grapes) TaxID=158190 RepID=G8QU97_SPHPG|nr:acetyl-CoA acetyltransferase [Sphaerochaeta pleomorpha]AEV28067.1 acetyl-CoA acetyltransferase [Sphaerochaeta pleomorpha str. Grapes]
MANIGIVGIGHTKFGNLSGCSITELLSQAAIDALSDASFIERRREVDQVFVANMASVLFCHQTSLASALVSQLDMIPVSAETVENGPASGASAIKLAYMAIASKMADFVLVVGGESMHTLTPWKTTDVVSTMLESETEYNVGLTLPAFGGMFTRLYSEKYGLTEKDLALLAVKAHANAAKNIYAHLQIPCFLEALTEGPDRTVINPPVAEPLRLYATCPVSDGAAAVLLANLDSPKATGFPKIPIRIAGIASATDTHCVHNRKDPLVLDAVRIATEKAYAMANIGPKDISFAELHDAFSILELAISEEAGLFERGKSFLAVRQGVTEIGGRLPVNTSGGLKAKGHPLGASGVSQAVELVRQLRNEAEEGRQVANPSYGLAVNFGGFGNNVVALICAKG